MRDKLKKSKYFKSFIDNCYNSLKNRKSKFASGLIKPEREISVKQAMISSYLHIITAKFSNGEKISNLHDDLDMAIPLIPETYGSNHGKVHISGTTYLNQYYIHNYQEVLQLISLGYLLNSNKLKILVNVIDKDKVCDNLYEFIFHSCFSNREQNV